MSKGKTRLPTAAEMSALRKMNFSIRGGGGAVVMMAHAIPPGASRPSTAFARLSPDLQKQVTTYCQKNKGADAEAIARGLIQSAK